jgi:hypothetical protein
MIACASAFPNSTPHWSNELTFQMTPCVQTGVPFCLHLLGRLAEGQCLGLREDIRQQHVVVPAERRERVAKSHWTSGVLSSIGYRALLLVVFLVFASRPEEWEEGE